jgi:hypothetical protein
MATALVSDDTTTRMAPERSQPTREGPVESKWRRARLPLAAVAAAATLYFVIAAVLKTDALEWFGSPWGGDDEVVVKHEPTRAFGAPAVPARADSGRVAGRAASAAPKRTTRTRGRSSPVAGDGRDTTDPEKAAPSADNPGRTPAKGRTSSAPAPAPAVDTAQDPEPESEITVTLPPPLPPVEVTLPPVEVEPPPLPVNPPPLPVTPPSVPPLELPALPTLP